MKSKTIIYIVFIASNFFIAIADLNCENNRDCRFPEYICKNKSCVECESDYHCSNSYPTNKCNVLSNKCVECNYDYECYSDRNCGSICLKGKCTRGNNCPLIDMRCKPSSQTCVECISPNDCQHGFYCNKTSNICQECQQHTECRTNLNCEIELNAICDTIKGVCSNCSDDLISGATQILTGYLVSLCIITFITDFFKI